MADEKKKSVRLKKSTKKETTNTKPKKQESIETKKTSTTKRVKMKVQPDAVYATGRRKESTAKVWIFKGDGQISINHNNPLVYLGTERLVNTVLQPLAILSLSSKYDIRVDINGGGLTGQAEAARLGISRAVLKTNEDFRPILREHGLLTQDSREKERKKYGKRGARKSPQYRKR